jgi:hypothetical protein
VAFGVGDIVGLLRTVDRLLELEKKHGTLIEAQAKELKDLAARVTRLESREEILVAEAKGASAAVASAVAAQHLVEMAQRIGALDERTKQLAENRRPLLPEPKHDE